MSEKLSQQEQLARYIEEASSIGYEYLGPTKTKDRHLYRAPCGHEQTFKPYELLGLKNRDCKQCREDQWVKDAESIGFKFLGPGTRKDSAFADSFYFIDTLISPSKER